MRRILIALSALAAPLAAAPAAPASDHQMRVNEVQLSAGGDASKQFVELRDPLDEPFPAPPYRLVFYDAAGTRLGSTDLPPMELQAADSNPYLVATASSGLPADEQMQPLLAPGSGKVCFTRSIAEQPIHCVAYGCPTVTGADRVLAPADGGSVQRQGDGSYALGSPTPKAANVSGTPAACTNGGGGGGGGGGGSGGGGGGTTPDILSPVQSLAFRKTQDMDRLAITLTLNEAASVTVSGSVNVPGAAKRLKIKRVTRSVAANARTKFRLRLAKKAKRAIRSALADGTKLRAAVRVSAEDTVGNVSTKKPKIRLKD